MNENPKRVPLDALVEFLVDDILQESDDAILEEFAEADGDPEEFARQMRGKVDDLVLLKNKHRLAAARLKMVFAAIENDTAARGSAEGHEPNQQTSAPQFSLAARNGRFVDEGVHAALRETLARLVKADVAKDRVTIRASVPAVALLKYLGVSEPNEIDLDAIAFAAGAEIERRHLKGCDAQIVGYGERAIILVDSRHSDERQRFSIAHELGHWLLHRGRDLSCSAHEAPSEKRQYFESEADHFAAELLMPRYLFLKYAERLRTASQLTAAIRLSEVFSTSITSTAIRLLDMDRSPSILVCHGHSGRKWFHRAPSAPTQWRPLSELSAETDAFSVLFGRKPNTSPRRVPARAWFDSHIAKDYFVKEQTMRIDSDQVLTMITPEEPMLRAAV